MSSKTKASLPVGSSLILDLKLKITKALLKALLHVREEKVFLMLKFLLNGLPAQLLKSLLSYILLLHNFRFLETEL